MSGPFVLVPIAIIDAMVSSSTAAEPGPGEIVWNAGDSHTVGQERILLSTHRVYECLIAGVDATSPDISIGLTTPHWIDKRPTNKWAAFDGQINTQSLVVTPLTYVLLPGVFNALALYGLDGANISISVKDAPGGTVIYSYTGELVEPPVDHYDYYFGRIKPLTKVLCRDIVPYANPEVTITISAATGITVKAGMIALGDLRTLITVEGNGGTQFGAKAKPITYSYINTDEFGVTKIIRRTKATDLDIRVRVPRADTDSALATIQDVLDVPAAWIGSDADGFTGLNVFGLASGDVSYEGPAHSIIAINVKGFI
jgi:hypothetical protein